jgi:hypothetical protein
VPFSYYARLTRSQQRVYRQSDGVTSLRLTHPAVLQPLVETLAAVLASEERAAVQEAADQLFGALARTFGTPPCRVVVLAARPHGQWGELQGLYETAERGRPAKVTLWMRTARQRRVVAFRTFLRTLLHELGHHLDYQFLRLADSFHTEGFYKRESSLFHQLVPEPASKPGSGGQLVPEPAKRSTAHGATTAPATD